MRRCHGCMREYRKEFDVCPHCGYIVDTAPKIKSHLAGGTILAERYMLGRVLGHGGFGITYIAWDKKLNRTVAIKEFFPNALSTRSEGETQVSCYDDKASRFFRDGVKKMLDEGTRLSKFTDNENIVNVYDCFEENNTAYIVMEYLDGEDLKKYIEEKGGKLSPEEAVEKILPVLNALEDMHKEKLIHRDISPDNIFLCKNGKIKLLDFGSARLAIEDSDKSLSVMVKRGYAPKEQYMSRSKQGPWTDVYAVCATLYKMITGVLPTESTERDEEPLKKLSEFGINNPELEKVIFKGLEVEAKNRTQSVAELIKLLTATHKKKEEVKVINVVTPVKKEDKPVAQSAETKIAEKSEPLKINPEDNNEERPQMAKETRNIIIAIVLACIVAAFFANNFYHTSGDAKWKLSNEGKTITFEGGGFGSTEEQGKVVRLSNAKKLLVEEIILEEGINYLGSSALADFYNLKIVHIPSSLTSIDGSFPDVKLEKVYYNGSLEEWKAIEGYECVKVVAGGLICNTEAEVEEVTTAAETIEATTAESTTRYSMVTDVAGNILNYTSDIVLVEGMNVVNSQAIYRFTPNRDGYYTFESSNAEDLYAKIYLNGVLVANDDDSGEEMNFRATAYMQKGKEHIINVGSYSENSGNLYAIRMNIAWSEEEPPTEPEETYNEIEYEYDLYGSCGDNLEWRIDWETGHMEIYGNGKMEDGIVNTGFDFKYIANDGTSTILSQEQCDRIKSITIYEGVTELGDWSLVKFGNIENISLPDSLTRIGTGAINGERLETLVLPPNLKTIEWGGLNNCRKLKSITIPASVTEIGMAAMPPGINANEPGSLEVIYVEGRKSAPSGWDIAWNNSTPVEWNV